MKARKILVMVMALALTAALAVGGTLAYLTSTKTVTNTFTVGNVQIKLDEAEVNSEGTPIDTKRTEVGNSNYHLLPGHTYTKDPTVAILPKSEKSYVRMLVTVSDIGALKTAIPSFVDKNGVFLLEKLTFNKNGVQTWDSTKWQIKDVTTATDSATGKNTATYEFRYYQTVKNDSATDNVSLEPLFTDITVPGTVDNTALAMLNGINIVVTAQAIQADGFATADAAWAAFED